MRRIYIYIGEPSGNRKILVPLVPEEIHYKSGDTSFITYNLMNRGDVSIPSGTGLSTISWESEFPGEGRKKDPMLCGTWKEPKYFHNILEDWKTKGTKLIVTVTGYPIDKNVYLSGYSAKPYGAFGDMSYEVEFTERRDITIKTTKTNSTKRTSDSASSYTIKSGDTLWGISKKFYGTGTKWQTIYNANKDIIEKTAKARWKAAGINRGSQNGHWIFAGTKLTIP